MKALLLSGYPLTGESNWHTPLSHFEGKLFIDWQIQCLIHHGFEPVVVLGGEDSDAILRASRRLESCEIVFDANGEERTLLSNLRAGLRTAHRECVVLPVEKPCPDRAQFQNLIQYFTTRGYQEECHAVAPGGEGLWPLLVTPKGLRLLPKTPEIATLQDPRVLISRASLVPLTTQVKGSATSTL